MKTQDEQPAPEGQKETDEAAAVAAETGDWDRFETEELLTDEGACEIQEFCRNLDCNDTLAQVTKQPFRWKQHVYRIVECEYRNGKPQVQVVPDDPEFAAEVRRRIEQNRFHILPYYQGYGFISFPEDFEKYQA